MRWALLLLVIAGCGMSPLGVLTGGGPSATAIGTQIGKENRQQIVAQENRVEAGRDVIQETTSAKADTIERVYVTNNSTPAWVWVALLIAALLPNPDQIYKYLKRRIRKTK